MSEFIAQPPKGSRPKKCQDTECLMGKKKIKVLEFHIWIKNLWVGVALYNVAALEYKRNDLNKRTDFKPACPLSNTTMDLILFA